MSRRSLRLAAAGFSKSEEAQNDALRDSSYAGNFSFREHSSKMAKQHRSTNKRSGSARQTPRRTLSSSSIFSQSSFNSHAGDSSMDVLDESLIQERTEVGHFWGLDEEGDPKVSDAAPIQGNGDVATTEAETSMINGYTCSGCSMLSERKEVLTAHSASPVPSSTIYSRDRSRKHAYTNSDYCGSMNVKEFYREDSHLGVNEESICDDCKGKKHLEIYTTDHMQSSWAKRVARTIWHTFSYAGYFMLHVLRTVGATGWLVSQKVLSLLWLAILSPGRAASGMFSLLRTRWYQLVTLMSLLKVVLLKRCLPKTYKLLLFLIPLLFLLGIGFWGFGGSISLLPSLSWTRTDRIGRTDDYTHLPEPQADSSHSGGCTKDTMTVFDAGRISQLEKQVAFMSDRCHHSDEEYSKVLLLLRNLQDQVAQMSDKSETLKLIKNVVGQHLKDKELEEKTDFLALHKEHQLRILTLEELLGKLSTESKDIQKELDAAKAKPVRDDDEHNQLLSRIKKLELELTQMKSELLTGESVKTSCEKLDVIPEKVDAWVKEYVKLMLFGDQQEDFPESLLQWLMSNFVSQNDLQTLLQDLEFQILKNITLHMSVTNQKLTSEVVTNAVTNAGISGITEAQVQIIVNNALKLYSQDKIGMVDFALESGGGSIVSTRCSETYETKTALFSLFGIPLWYMSQSPRVVIQPDIHPGNCWAFRGSPGYLVVKLSMKIYPTAFTVEHIPKTLSPTGNITSAPKNFSVYGLDDEYQEDGTLLGQYVYDQEGEPLQMFPVMEKSEKTFQIVELRIFSNWGHEKYTCLYRFRVHGKPAE
ncbi:SUN domain-containing protein 1 isoform X5 [Falco rusticolus]|uniref:SUN domain-containing protein 1 isoform X5 n=1 Tax=Falco rusticolus TaxID=120794 RepID=UPI00188691B2|nr:SUN domain-containing protein 1 isoform X5 [Falco rusticolus]XP_055564693.1 SUN domain-containing protein 1 isoform X4 [Falco cherrug]